MLASFLGGGSRPAWMESEKQGCLGRGSFGRDGEDKGESRIHLASGS